MAGKGTLEFRYEPTSLTWGARLSGLTLLILLVWLGFSLREGTGRPPAPEPVARSAAGTPQERTVRGDFKRRRRRQTS
jgi:hypothetical protein